METRLADMLRALDNSTPYIVVALTALLLLLCVIHLVRWVRQLRVRRETTLRDLELGIVHPRRRIPLGVHTLIGFAAGMVMGAGVLVPWLLLAAAHEGLPASAIVPGLVGDSILAGLVTASITIAIVAIRRRWTARTERARDAGTAYRIRGFSRRVQWQEEDW